MTTNPTGRRRKHPVPTKNELFKLFTDACKPLSNGALRHMTNVDDRYFRHLVTELEDEGYIELKNGIGQRALTAKGHVAASKGHTFPDGDIIPKVKRPPTAEQKAEARQRELLRLSRGLFKDVFQVRWKVW